MHSDILILGAGCAGLTAGIYAARAGRQVRILENGVPGGQTAITTRIDNYPGVPGADGFALMQTMAAQAKDAGAELVTCEVRSADLRERQVETGEGSFTADAVILATGAVPRELGIPGEREFRGRGVSYCASCDGWFYRDREVYVVGGGNSAGEESLYLADIGRKVHMLVRKGQLRCHAAIGEKVLHHPKIQVHFYRELLEIRGRSGPEVLRIRNAQTGEIQEWQAAEDGKNGGVFIFAGYRPASDFFWGQVDMEENGYVLTDGELRTSLPWVYAAGDVRQKTLRQIVTAAADGAIAASTAVHDLGQMG